MVPLLEIKGARKQFARVLANDDVSFTVERGEVRALLGENGAGKSTLMSCLYGLFKLDAGTIYIDGKEVDISTCNEAIRLGIGMVNQHFMLVQKLSVVENVILGLKSEKWPWMDLEGAAKKIRELSDRYHFNIDPYAKVEDLSVGMEQRVEILKVLYRESQLMIFDEPTAVLTPNEVLDFFEIIKKFKAEGRTIIFITHKLHEVMSICDSVTVLRDGKLVGNLFTKDTNESELAKMMVGREINLHKAEPAEDVGGAVLSVQDLYVKNTLGIEAVKGLSFEVCSGEILGIAGVDGNGQLELGQALTGMKKPESGSIIVIDEDTTFFDPGKLLDAGVSHIPQDRQKTGLIMDYSVEDNLVSKEISKEPFSKWGVINRKKIREHANRLVKAFDIRVTGADTLAKQLSGGNQQKIILAREFDRGPRLIIAIQPTRGVDIAAIEFVRKELIRQRDAGAAILLISTELEEVIALSDRIEVIYEGEFTGSIKGKDVDPLKIGLQMAGKTGTTAGELNSNDFE